MEEQGPPVGEGSHTSQERPPRRLSSQSSSCCEVERLAASNTATKSALDELQAPLAQMQEALTSMHNVVATMSPTLWLLVKASCNCASGP